MKTKMKIAQSQIIVGHDKSAHEDKIRNIITEAAAQGADMVCFPEMSNCPYQTRLFVPYAEPHMGETWQLFSSLAAEHKIYVSAGSIPETGENGKIYNTAYVFDREGKEIAKHRKMHLYDVDVKGGVSFKESDIFEPGNEVTVFDTEFGKGGLIVCYDVRFPELTRLMLAEGMRFLVVPAAFNMTTGPLHWELLFRSQASNNQIFTIGTALARDPDIAFNSWGHSIVCDPWAKVLSQADEHEALIFTEIDLDVTEQIREQMPALKHRRTDIYEVVRK